MRIVAWLSVAALLVVSGCSAGSGMTAHDAGRHHEGGYPDSGSLIGDAGPISIPCTNDGTHPCSIDTYVCAVDPTTHMPRCVPDPNPPPPGDGTHCEPCPAPGECRMDVCVPPSPGGQLCEFDDSCPMHQICIGGRCTPDPRIPVPCSDPSVCAPGFTCTMGTCHCVHTSDCASGLACVDGACTPGSGCIADVDCPSGDVCEAGTCRPRTVCDIVAPNLAGNWPTMHSTLHFREALPGWLSSLLNALEGPFLFLAGDTACIDFGLGTTINNAICGAIAPYIHDALPDWAPPLFRAIAHLNQVLQDWDIDEHMTLTAGSVANSYRGTHTWDRVSFVYAGTTVTADPTMVFDWMFTPSDFNASVTCGVFTIDRHAVHVSVGAIVAWLVNAVIEVASHGTYHSLDDVLNRIAMSFCSGLADAAEQAVPDYPGVASAVDGICTSTLGGFVTTAVNALTNARLGADPITLRGTGQIGGPNSLVMGHWDGELVGSDFSGEWQAMRP